MKLLGQLDNEPLGAADLAEPVAVLVGACGSPVWVGGEWNFTSSISPWPAMRSMVRSPAA